MSAGTLDPSAVRRPRLLPWAFAAPALVIYLAFLVWPALQALWISLTDWDGLSDTQHFVGLANYTAMLSDSVVGIAAVNNVLWALVTIALPMVLGLLLAVVLNRRSRTSPVLRSVFYAPAVLPLVSIASIWAWLYDPTDGAINTVLGALGLDALQQSWLGQDSTALWAVMIPAVWVRTGFPMLLYLAALQSIPSEQYEAASMDGANRWQQFWRITVPSLRDTHYIVLALSLIESFKAFDLVYAMTYGGPGYTTQVMGTWMYANVFQYFEAGYGTAIAVVITLVALAAGIPYVRSQVKSS
ncbi:sugar ABC transporter permease [Brachybacterium sp. NBEC-018]|uniref:carbohydrate ABC transporter permease n=1 Tax=Brachybacterium sp. NBEC-018 TaxID=2996004 RepID=UPI002175550A|nr:sugar ABC transporter permease [Brachybacterium sp. NBEC-018]UVY84519.1 sugar ABC transporter permease [Brachybacterium sp. NBEC-018]